MSKGPANIKTIEFDVRDWKTGFFVSFRIPYTDENYATVVALPGSANIKLIK